MDRNIGDRRKRSDATGGRHRRWLYSLALLVISGLIFIPAVLYAVHDLDFQLDGDVIASTTTSKGNPAKLQSVDWDSLFNVNGTTKALLPTGFSKARLDRDFQSSGGNLVTADTTTYATGSKDTLPISGWQCNFDNNVNSKIDIMNAYAATYTAANGDKVLYFGLERNVNTGDANVGFWFLKSNVDCSSTGGAVTFTGTHQDGDILIVSAFTGGGKVSEISAYRWCQAPTTNAACQSLGPTATGFIDPTAVAGSGDCRDSDHPADDAICAVANANDPTGVGVNGVNGTITTPWLTASGKKTGNSLPTAQFFEGGINLTKTNLVGCFNEFIGDTRSSQSLTATLFDYAEGVLGGCTTDVVSTPSITGDTTVIPADPTSALLSVTDSVAVTAHGVSGAWSGTVTFYLCGPFASGTTTTCDSPNGVKIGANPKSVSGSGDGSTGNATSDSATISSAGRYCWRSDFVHTSPADLPDGSDHSSGECFEIQPRQPTLSTQATAGPVPFGSKISDTVTLANTAHKPGTDGAVVPSINASVDGGDATGNVNVVAYGPDSCSTVAFTSGTIAASGDGSVGGAGSAFEFTPSAPGQYVFVAAYAGDSPNTLSIAAGACSGAPDSEKVTVQQISTGVQTKQGWYPQDTATVKAKTGNLGSPSDTDGTLLFELFMSSDCSGTAQYSESKSVLHGAQSRELTTSNTSFFIATGYGDAADTVTPVPPTVFSWRVTYTPNASDTAHTGSSSSCSAEHFTIKYTNDPGPTAIFP